MDETEREDWSLASLQGSRIGVDPWSRGRAKPWGALGASAENAAKIAIIGWTLLALTVNYGELVWFSVGMNFMWALQTPVVNALAALSVPRRGFSQLWRSAKAMAWGILEIPLVGCLMLLGLLFWIVKKVKGEEILTLCFQEGDPSKPWLVKAMDAVGDAMEVASERCQDSVYSGPWEMTQTGSWRTVRQLVDPHMRGHVGAAAKVWLACPFNPAWTIRVDSELMPGHVKSWTSRFGRECPFVDALGLFYKQNCGFAPEEAEFVMQVARLARAAMEAKDIHRASAIVPAISGAGVAEPVRRRSKSL